MRKNEAETSDSSLHGYVGLGLSGRCNDGLGGLLACLRPKISSHPKMVAQLPQLAAIIRGDSGPHRDHVLIPIIPQNVDRSA